MRALMERAEAAAREGRGRLVERFAALVADRITGATVEAGDDEVRVRGANVVRRMLADPDVRFFPGGGR